MISSVFLVIPMTAVVLVAWVWFTWKVFGRPFAFLQESMRRRYARLYFDLWEQENGPLPPEERERAEAQWPQILPH